MEEIDADVHFRVVVSGGDDGHGAVMVLCEASVFVKGKGVVSGWNVMVATKGRNGGSGMRVGGVGVGRADGWHFSVETKGIPFASPSSWLVGFL